MKTEYNIDPRARIETEMTHFAELRKRSSLIICILENSTAIGNLYDTSSLEVFRNKYWSATTSLDDEGLTKDFALAKIYNTQVFGIPIEADRQTIVTKAIEPWAALLNISISFTRDPALANVRFGITSFEDNINYTPGPKVGSRDGQSPVSDVFLNDTLAKNLGVADPRNLNTWMHEFGHAMGLSHPARDAGQLAFPEYDKNRWSVMGYTRNGVTPVAPMLFDALGLKKIGLLKSSINSEDGNVYKVEKPGEGKLVIDTGGGDDTLSAENQTMDSEIDLRATDFDVGKAYLSSIGVSKGTGNVAIYEGTMIENAIGGSGNDKLIGNDLANVLDGGEGNDTLEGGAGSDTYKFSGKFGKDRAVSNLKCNT